VTFTSRWKEGRKAIARTTNLRGGGLEPPSRIEKDSGAPLLVPYTKSTKEKKKKILDGTKSKGGSAGNCSAALGRQGVSSRTGELTGRGENQSSSRL